DPICRFYFTAIQNKGRFVCKGFAFENLCPLCSPDKILERTQSQGCRLTVPFFLLIKTSLARQHNGGAHLFKLIGMRDEDAVPWEIRDSARINMTTDLILIETAISDHMKEAINGRKQQHVKW